MTVAELIGQLAEMINREPEVAQYAVTVWSSEWQQYEQLTESDVVSTVREVRFETW